MTLPPAETPKAAPCPPQTALESLTAYSRGELGRDDAIRAVGVRDYAGLLVALGDAGLPMPKLPDAEIEAQVETFVSLWNAR